MQISWRYFVQGLPSTNGVACGLGNSTLFIRNPGVPAAARLACASASLAALRAALSSNVEIPFCDIKYLA